MRYKEFTETSWSQIGKTSGSAQDLSQSQKIISQTKSAFKQEFGKELQTNSEHRTREEQMALFQRKGERGIFMPADPRRTPNAEYFHLFSMDISQNQLDQNQRKWLRQQGWQLVHGARDPVHWQFVGPRPQGSQAVKEPQATQGATRPQGLFTDPQSPAKPQRGIGSNSIAGQQEPQISIPTTLKPKYQTTSSQYMNDPVNTRTTKQATTSISKETDPEKLAANDFDDLILKFLKDFNLV
jgi:hypothetical protein